MNQEQKQHDNVITASRNAGRDFARRQIMVGEVHPDEWIINNLSSEWVVGYMDVYAKFANL